MITDAVVDRKITFQIYSQLNPQNLSDFQGDFINSIKVKDLEMGGVSCIIWVNLII